MVCCNEQYKYLKYFCKTCYKNQCIECNSGYFIPEDDDSKKKCTKCSTENCDKCKGTKISNTAAEEFIKFVDLLPYGLPTNFDWDFFKILDEDRNWSYVRIVVINSSFAEEYTEEVKNKAYGA